MTKRGLFASILTIVFGIATAQNDGDLRLVDGTVDNEGRLEIYHNSVWGTVCDDRWGMNEATVACRQLGYLTVLRYVTDAGFGRGDSDQVIWLDNVECDGDENKLMYCDNRGWGNHDCGHDEDIGLVCGSSSGYEGQVRLAGSSVSTNGRVEIYHAGAWGTVCNDGWGNNEARVVCRQLGYPSVYDSFTSYGAGTGPIHLDNVVCSGYEDELSACRHSGWGYHNCDHYEDVGVRCSTHSPMTGWLISVIVVSSLLGFFLLCAVIGTMCCCSSKKRKQRQTRSTPQTTPSSNPTAVATIAGPAGATVHVYPMGVPPPSAPTGPPGPPPSYSLTMTAPGSLGGQPPVLTTAAAYPPQPQAAAASAAPVPNPANNEKTPYP